MPKYPIRLHELACKIPRMRYQETATWASLQASPMHGIPLDEMLSRRAADALAHQFAGYVYEHSFIDRRTEPHGIVTTVDAYAFTHHELMELLYRAYTEGQSDGAARRATLEV